MANREEFALLIGKIIHNCGLLESPIPSLTPWVRDKVLVAEFSTLSFGRRIEILRRLLIERTELSPEKVASLYKQLCSVSEERNIVAHNPVASSSTSHTDPHIIKLTDVNEILNAKKLAQKDLEELLERTREAVELTARKTITDKP